MVLDIDSANAAVDAVTSLLDGGFLDIYSGMVRLVRLPLAGFSRAGDGMAEANEIQPGTAVESGEATRFECVRASGKVVFSGRVGRLEADTQTAQRKPELELSSKVIRRFAVVTIESLTYTQGRY